MKSSTQTAKINGENVEGLAHIQPGVNKWIGIFEVSDTLAAEIQKSKAPCVIDYEGPFNCGKECVKGFGKAKVIYYSPTGSEGKIKISIEGLDEPQLEKEVKPIKFSYNENLPPNTKPFS